MTTNDPNLNYSTPNPPSQLVSGPGIALLVAGVLYLLGGIAGLLMNILRIGVGAAAMEGDARVQQLAGGAGGIIGAILALIFGAIIVFGAIKMRQLQSYGLAMTASILAMLPCSCCCIIGLPIGIWSLVTLMKPEVKAAFR
jgi:hypothetical protein